MSKALNLLNTMITNSTNRFAKSVTMESDLTVKGELITNVEANSEWKGYDSVEHMNRIDDAIVNKSTISKFTDVTQVPIKAGGITESISATPVRYPCITKEHYFVIPAEATLSKHLTENRKPEYEVMGEKRGNNADVTDTYLYGGEIQCRRRKDDSIVWMKEVADITGVESASTSGVTAENGTVYGGSWLQTMKRSAPHVFALDEYTGATKWNTYIGRYRLVFDNVKYIPDGYKDVSEVPLSESANLPEFVLRFGNFESGPIKVGINAVSLERVLERLGFQNVHVSMDAPYINPVNGELSMAGRQGAEITPEGELNSGALAYDIFVTPVKGVHFDRAQSQLTTRIKEHMSSYDTSLGPYYGKANAYNHSMRTYKFHDYIDMNEDNFDTFYPNFTAALVATPSKVVEQNPQICEMLSLNNHGAMHNIPVVYGDNVYVTSSSIAYHVAIMLADNSRFDAKRYLSDQTIMMSLNKYSGKIEWISKIQPDHLLPGQVLPQSAAWFNTATQSEESKVIMRHFMRTPVPGVTDQFYEFPVDAAGNPLYGTHRLFFSFGAQYGGKREDTAGENTQPAMMSDPIVYGGVSDLHFFNQQLAYGEKRNGAYGELLDLLKIKNDSFVEDVNGFLSLFGGQMDYFANGATLGTFTYEGNIEFPEGFPAERAYPIDGPMNMVAKTLVQIYGIGSDFENITFAEMGRMCDEFRLTDNNVLTGRISQYYTAAELPAETVQSLVGIAAIQLDYMKNAIPCVFATHPGYVDETIDANYVTHKDMDNFFFFYEKDVGTVLNAYESYELMYAGGAIYGNGSCSIDPKSKQAYYSTGHLYNAPTNDIIKLTNEMTGNVFDWNTYNFRPGISADSEASFNPVGEWTAQSIIRKASDSAVMRAGLLSTDFDWARYMHNALANNTVTEYYNHIRKLNAVALSVQTAAAGATHVSTEVAQPFFDEIAAFEAYLVQRNNKFVECSSKRGAGAFGSSLLAVDLKTGKLQWAYRQIANSIFQHEGKFTYNVAPNQGWNTSCSVVSDLPGHGERNVLVANNKTGVFNRLLAEPEHGELTLGGITYPASMKDRVGNNIHVPNAMITGYSGQWGGSVFQSWSIDKDNNMYMILNNSGNDAYVNFYMAARDFTKLSWIDPSVGVLAAFDAFQQVPWITRSSDANGHELILNGSSARIAPYMCKVDLKSNQLLWEKRLWPESFIPAPASLPGWLGRPLIVNDVIIYPYRQINKAITEELNAERGGPEITREMKYQMTVMAQTYQTFVARDLNDFSVVWESPPMFGGDMNVTPPIVDGKMYFTNFHYGSLGFLPLHKGNHSYSILSMMQPYSMKQWNKLYSSPTGASFIIEPRLDGSLVVQEYFAGEIFLEYAIEKYENNVIVCKNGTLPAPIPIAGGPFDSLAAAGVSSMYSADVDFRLEFDSNGDLTGVIEILNDILFMNTNGSTSKLSDFGPSDFLTEYVMYPGPVVAAE